MTNSVLRGQSLSNSILNSNFDGGYNKYNLVKVNVQMYNLFVHKVLKCPYIMYSNVLKVAIVHCRNTVTNNTKPTQ